MFEKQISQSLQDAIKKITSVSEALVGNQHKIDKNKNGKIDAHDFKLLKGQKAAPMKEESVEEAANRAQQAAIAISLIKAGKKDGKMPKPMKEEDTADLDEARKLEGTYSHSNGNQSKVYKLSGEHNELAELKKSTVKSYASKKQAEVDDVPPLPFKKPVPSNAEHEKNAKGMMGALARLSGKKPTSESIMDMGAGLGAGRSQGVAEGTYQLAELKKSTVKSYASKKQAEMEEQVDETIVKHDDFTVEIKESYTFADYLIAAKQLVGEEEAVTYANEAFKTQDLTIFIMEEMSRGDIEDNINAHRKAGHTVSMPKYSTKDGKPHAEYMVTDKDEGTKRKYIHHGNVRKVQNMGAKGY